MVNSPGGRTAAENRDLCWPISIGLVLFFALALALPAQHAEAADPSAPSSSMAARNEALRAIPWSMLSPGHRQGVKQVVQNASIYRRLPTRVIDCDPEIFTFLAQHPEVVVDVWRVMGISRVAVDRVSDHEFRAVDGAGTNGRVQFLYADWRPGAENLAVIYSVGNYSAQPMPQTIQARCVMLLRSGSIRETNGRQYVTVRLDSFVDIQQTGIELVAKTIQPLINKTADQNFIETLTFVSHFSRTAERNPQGIGRLAERLTSVDPTTRNELVRVSFATAQRYAGQNRQPAIRPVVYTQQGR